MTKNVFILGQINAFSQTFLMGLSFKPSITYEVSLSKNKAATFSLSPHARTLSENAI